MSHTVGDNIRQMAKIYRDHMKEVPREMRTSRRGFLMVKQRDDGTYEISCPGDEIGWVFLSPRTTEKTQLPTMYIKDA